MRIDKTMFALVLGALMAAGSAGAATITFDPSSSSVGVGDTFQVTLVGRDFTEGAGGTYGGGVSIAWNPALFRMVSYDTSVFGGDQLLATSNTDTVLDNVTGVLSDLSVASFFVGVTDADFDIALLTFEALAPGQSALTASIGYFTSGFENIWTDSEPFDPIVLDPQFVAGTLTASVPEPASACLLLSALAGLGLLQRKRA